MDKLINFFKKCINYFKSCFKNEDNSAVSIDEEWQQIISNIDYDEDLINEEQNVKTLTV